MWQKLHKFVALHSLIISRPNLLKIAKYTNSSRDMATDAKFTSEVKSDLKDVFRAAVKAVSPNEIVRRKVKFRDNTLYINEKSFPLRENVYLVGFGKAVMGMAQELEKLLGNVLRKGIVSVPSMSKDAIWTSEDTADFPKLYNSVIDYREGGVNNQPDVRSLNTTHDIIDLVENLKDTDTLIMLISGGGSALLYMPRPVLDQDDKLELCKKLQNAGANITELNTVRKKLSLVKGGGLARMAYPASVISLILSDIVGDPVDLIASGPTVYSAKAPESVVAILKKYHLYESLDSNLKKFLSSKETFRDITSLLTPAKQFKHVTNIILGNNTTALEAASLEALRKKWTPIILRNDITGNVQDVSLAYVRIASLICLFWSKELEREVFYDRMRTVPALPLTVDKIDEIFHCITNNFDGLLLIGGGEPTVVVKGQGKGGRNQELALRFSLDWLAEIKSYPQLVDFDVIMLSGGTDGQDGPTDAAGAFGYPAIAPIVHALYAEVKSTIDRNILTRDQCKAQQMSVTNTELHGQNLDTTEVSTSATGDSNENLDCSVLTLMEVERMLPENTLKENDTYNFYSRFKKGEDLIKTGITGTNVMDLHLIYIKKRRCQCEHELKSLNRSECKTDGLNAHDLHIDKETIEKYKTIRASKSVEDFLPTPHLTVKAEEDKPFLNIKIIDDSFTEPCCNKKKSELD